MKLILLCIVSGSIAAQLVGTAQPQKFGAYYTRIASAEEFEGYSRTGDDADIVVQLAAPEGRLAFWRGASYLPFWETSQGRWYLDEVIPRHGDGEGRRVDRVNSFSHVALIESSAKKAVISWRYLPAFEAGNPHPGVDPTRFAEEQFEVYADGRILRSVRQGTIDVSAWNDPLTDQSLA